MNSLLRVIDSYCEGRRWDDLVDLADRCEQAIERGKQLWPIAAHVDYRLALEAPPEYAAEAMTSDLGRFTLGPLTEVAASTHTWDELAPHIHEPHIAAYVAQERVLRGEDLSADADAHPEVLELPLRLEPFEPTYALANYKASVVEVAEPWEPKAFPEERQASGDAEILDEPDVESALLELVTPWTAESNGAARVVVVEGTAEMAVSALTMDRFRIVAIDPAEVLQRMAWAAAGGGAHGRRRGAALGRSLAWHAAAVVCDLPWPVDPEVLGNALDELNWFLWDEAMHEEGWVLRLAVEDPADGWAAALAATDLLGDDDE